MFNKKLFYFLICWGFCLAARAQKLPNVQEQSLRAPKNVKVDGSPSEWDNKFAAYNHATDIFYTMSNDDNNLYLSIQTNDPNIVSRIMGKGITLTIKNTDSEGEKFRAAITYPLVKHTPYFNLRNKKNASEVPTQRQADSLMKHNNKLIDDSCRYIQVNGIPGVDTLISVYNRVGIKARAQFNIEKVFTCEFSVKLKLLNLSVNDATKISYRISVNGAKSILPPPGVSLIKTAGTGHEAEDEKQSAELREFISKRSAATFLDGEYNLINK